MSFQLAKTTKKMSDVAKCGQSTSSYQAGAQSGGRGLVVRKLKLWNALKSEVTGNPASYKLEVHDGG